VEGWDITFDTIFFIWAGGWCRGGWVGHHVDNTRLGGWAINLTTLGWEGGYVSTTFYHRAGRVGFFDIILITRLGGRVGGYDSTTFSLQGWEGGLLTTSTTLDQEKDEEGGRKKRKKIKEKPRGGREEENKMTRREGGRKERKGKEKKEQITKHSTDKTQENKRYKDGGTEGGLVGSLSSCSSTPGLYQRWVGKELVQCSPRRSFFYRRVLGLNGILDRCSPAPLFAGIASPCQELHAATLPSL